jgi:type I restriction enzyme R subunit
MHGQRPIIFVTNGFETKIWDDTFYPPRPVQGIYTQEELKLSIQRRKSRKDIREAVVNEFIVERYYQKNSIKRVAEKLVNKKDGKLIGLSRAALIVMATGAGKTRTAAALVDVLTKSNWIKKALFLADRNALVRQAKNAFNEHLPHLSAIDLTREKEDKNTRLVFSTYPTIMNRIDDTSDNERMYGPGHFDLIIVDEAHRSIYKKYKAIFDYFDAIRIGLTATPRAEADKDTYALFDCEEHSPTFYYELEEAVHDGFLVPPKGQKVDLGFIQRGIKYDDLSEEEKDKYEETFRDEEEGEFPKEINASAINSWLFNSDTIDKMLAHLMEYGLKIDGGDKIGKTIIFARSHKHAEEIDKRFNKQYPQYSGEFLKIIDNYDKYAIDTLEDFKSPDKLPQISVSVDMLDTGIDIPEILNLVFFKPVYSKTKFWQMIGRGTRKCNDLFNPGQHKEYFNIFDFCRNFEFFEVNPEGIETSVPKSLSHKIFETNILLSESLREEAYKDEDLIQLRVDCLDFGNKCVRKLWDLRQNFRIKMALRWVDHFKERKNWDNLSKSDISDLFEHLGPLVELDDPDEAAKRFDLLIMNLQQAIIEESSRVDFFQSELKGITKKLSEITNITAVHEQLPTIQLILNEETKFDKSFITQLGDIKRNLRGLIKLIDKGKVKIYYTDFKDSIENIEEVPGLYDMPGGRSEDYRQKVEKHIRDHKNDLVISKLIHNVPVTSEELIRLEEILFDGEERGTKEEFQKELGAKQPLGVFIRSILGMDVNSAKEAFSEFMNKGNLRADQEEFVNNIINHLSINGVIDKRMLAQTPFTDINDQGIFGVFEDEDVMQIISIIDRVNNNAIVA